MATPKEKQNSCLQFHKIFFPVPTEKCVKITIPQIKSKKRRLSTGNIRSKPDKPVHFRQVRSKIFLIVKFLSRLELQHVLKRPRYHHKKGLVWLVFKILLEQKKYMYIKSAHPEEILRTFLRSKTSLRLKIPTLNKQDYFPWKLKHKETFNSPLTSVNSSPELVGNEGGWAFAWPWAFLAKTVVEHTTGRRLRAAEEQKFRIVESILPFCRD